MEKMDELLVKYLLGEANEEEKVAIEQWLNAAELNRKYFEHFKLIWKTGELLKVESKLDPEQSWTEFRALADERKASSNPNIRPMIRRMRIAAIWLGLFGAAALAYVFLFPHQIKTITFETADLVKIDTLPDGSVVTLNKNTAISYPEKFRGSTREIALLHGEAFFKIEHDASKPFLIHVNDLVVRDIGTSFNIRSGKQQTEVIVETGVVLVTSKNVVIKLRPKDKISIDKHTGELKKGQSGDEFYNYYRTNRLVANQTPLWRVAQVLSQVYQVNITISDPQLARRTFTTILNIGSLDSNLQVIAETFNVKISRKPGQIIIQ